MRRLFVQNRVAMYATGFLALCLLLVSLYGIYSSMTTPRERQVSVPVLSYQQQGQFAYTVRLKPNALFDSTELGPGQQYFARLIDNLRMTYSYHLSADQPLQPGRYTYQVNAVFGSQRMWQRTYPLVPPTVIEQPDFSFSFVLSIPQFVSLLETIQEQTRATMDSPGLTINVRVEPQVTTAAGTISEPFEQSLVFQFDGEAVRQTQELQKMQPGGIVKKTLEPVPGLAELRVGSWIAMALSALALAYLGRLALTLQPHPAVPDQDLRKAQKQLKGLLVATDELPPLKADQTVIRVRTLPELLGLAEETLRPVIYSRNGHGIYYCLLDGLNSVRYEYCDSQPTVAAQGERANAG